MKLYIIRHGQTDWNIAKKIQGRQDIPLNERGHFQAQCLGKAMENRPITAVFSSPQIRANGNSNRQVCLHPSQVFR